MKKSKNVLTMVLSLLFSLASMAQTIVNEEISLTGHIDNLAIADKKVSIGKNVKANYVLKMFLDPSDNSRPQRRTITLYADLDDWKASMGVDSDFNIRYSWSGRNINIVLIEDSGIKCYAIGDTITGTTFALVVPNYKGESTISITGDTGKKGDMISGLYPGMHIDDLARFIQNELPGTRVVLSGKSQSGLKEYLLLWYGESKVYDVTGDYHYKLNNNEPYFSFWCDSNNKLVKWFKLK